jgi:ribosomal-protein-alanine N-acetyltransferase
MRVYLETPAPRHEEAFLAAVLRSRRLHKPWVTAPSSSAEYRVYLKGCKGPRADKHFVCDAGGEICGVMNLSEIVRGSFQSAYLGYYALHPHAGKGLMSEGLEILLVRVFGELGLHRVEANIQPGNAPSLALVARAGFRHEGISPRYLKIGGRWRDHERWAITIEDRKLARRATKLPPSP